MVASFLQKCFGCQSSIDYTNEYNEESIGAPVLDYCPTSSRAQDEELLSLLREPLLALEGSWFTRMRLLLDVLEERGGLRATLVGVVRGDPQPQTACYVLLESSNARTDDVVDHGYSFPFVNREVAVVILQACVSKMAVPATTSRSAACVPLLHGGVAMGALWLTLETSQRKSLVRPVPAAPAAVRSSALGSGASGASMWRSSSGHAASATAAAALLANGTSLDTLAFTISMVVQGGDSDQLPWLTAAVHRLCAAGTMHTLAADLCDLVAAHVLRKFVLDTAVRAVLVPGDGGTSCSGTGTGPPDSNGGTAPGVGYLLGAFTGPNAAMGSPLQQSAASSRGVTHAQYSSVNGNTCSLNDASQLEPSPNVGVIVEAAVGPLGPAVEGQLQQHLPGLPRAASIGISTGLRASGLGPRAEPKTRRLSLLAAGSHSGGLPRDVVRASALNSGTPQPQDQQQAEPIQHDQQQRTKQMPQQQLQQASLRQSPSLQQLMFQQQGQALGLGGLSHGQGRPPAGWLLRRPHSVKSVMAADPLPGLATAAAAAAAAGGPPAAIAVDLILSRRTLSGTTTTRPLVVALPLGADPTAAAGPASAFLRAADTRASKSANAANTCTNINSFLATAGCNSASAMMNSWHGGNLPPPSTTVTAHTFPLQHTLLQVCSNAAASGNGFTGSGGGVNNPAIVEDCCSLLQDVHRPCRDVCLLMGIFSQQQELQKLQHLSPALVPSPVPTPLQRACVQLQEHLNATGASAGAPWRAAGVGGVCASPTGTRSPVRIGTGNTVTSGPNGGSASIFRGGGGLGAGLRSLVVVLVPSHRLTASSRMSPLDGPGATAKNTPSSPGYLALYVCFQARLPRSLLEAVRASCQELVDEVLCRVVASRMCGDLAPELEVFKGATPGSYAVLRGLELNDEGNGPLAATQPGATASVRPVSSGGGRATSSRRRGLSGAQSGVGVHALSLYGRPSAQAPLGGNPLAGGSVPGPSHGGQGPVPSRVAARQTSGIISGMLLNTDELVAPAATGPGQQQPQQPPPSPPGRSILPQAFIKGFLSMRGTNNDDGGRGGDIAGIRGSANDRVSLSLEGVLRPFNIEARAQAAPRVPRVPARGLQASAVQTGGSVIDPEDPSVAVVTAGENATLGAGGCPPDQLLSTATTNVEDLLGSLIDSMTGMVPTNNMTNPNNNGRPADSGGAARSGGVGLLWHCNSILHVTAEDAREMARQQMDALVSSITATAADTVAAARTAFLGDLAHLQLLEVLGRGGGGVVLRGKSGATDVAVKLMEMPITPDLQPPSPQQGQGQPVPRVGEDTSERDRLMLRNRRAMLRHAMELWCGSMLSHPNIVQVYTTFNSVVLKLRKNRDGSHQFYLQPVPETLRNGRHHQQQQQQQQQQHLQQGTMAAAVSGEVPVPTNGGTPPASPAPPAATAGDAGGKDNDPLEPNDSICTAILVEWCDKGSLATALCARTFPRIVPRLYDDVFKAMPYDMKDVYLTLLDVALALRHLHSLHLVHRDLKAANLLLKSNPLDPRGVTVKLADFGFVLQLNEVDAEGNRYAIVDQPAGTVTHMPPEALSKDPRIDASADVYGFGIIMWELLAGGLRPYSQLPLDRIPRLVVKGGRPNFPENVPASYRRLASACWSMQPCKRPPAAELVSIITAELSALG